MPVPLLNVRVEDDIQDAIGERAAELGIKKSVWVREVLAACAVGGVTMDDLAQLMKLRERSGSPHPERHLLLQASSGRIAEGATRACKHPLVGRIQLAFSVRCGSCGETVKRTL